MTDLYDLLNRAIDSQPDTPEARLAVYNHVRGLYERQRQEIDPTLPEAEILSEQSRLMREQASLETVIARIEAERTGAPAPAEEVLSFDRFAADDAPQRAPETDVGGTAAPLDAGRGRPRVAPRREPREGSSARRGIAIAAVALVLAAIGASAWWLRTDLPAPTVEETPAVAEAPAQQGNDKIVERVGGEPPEDAPAQEAPAQPAADAAPVGQPAQPAQQPAAAGEQPEIVAQRAFLFEMDDQNREQPKITPGQALWRIEGKGSRSAVLYADVSLPEAGFSFSLVMRANEDTALPASHTIEITFVNAADKPERVVRDMAVPQLRVDKEPRGVALAGLPIPVADNVFLIGLSSVKADIARNYDLLRERDWIDLTVRFANGNVGTVTFAKGGVGRQIIADAIDSWR